jgi:tRNA threonylcarbamoyladenosine biosynthesis protein TsaB
VIILIIRTDQPEAEAGLFDDQKQLGYIKWLADRQLSSTLNLKITEILNKSSISLDKVDGIIVFKGPGSFTGLRIGFSVANALAYGLQKPVIATGGQAWIQDGIKALLQGKNDKIGLPDYGAPAKTTLPKK